MDEDGEDEILISELARLGAGARGAPWAARRLRKDACEIEATITPPLEEAHATVVRLLGSIGRVIDQADSGGGTVVVRGVAGSGMMNLNPAVLTVTLTAGDASGTKVLIRGAAKEGLIKQKAGEKAARRLAAMLM